MFCLISIISEKNEIPISGHSWRQRAYKDSVPSTSPNLTVILSTFKQHLLYARHFSKCFLYFHLASLQNPLNHMLSLPSLSESLKARRWKTFLRPIVEQPDLTGVLKSWNLPPPSLALLLLFFLGSQSSQ